MTFRAIKKEILPVSILLAFCLYLFRDILFGGHLLFGADFNAFYLGMKQFFYNELHDHGSIPYWNPYILGGIPFWAHFESTIFYPLGFLFWLLAPEKAYGYTMFIHIFLAGLFMYALARSLNLSRTGSFVSAIAFATNGFIMPLLYMGQMSPVQSYIWLPLIVLCVNKALNSKTPFLPGAIAGALWGIQILAGAPQDAFYTFFASILLVACRALHKTKNASSILKCILVGLLVFGFGTGLASVQIIPAFELVGESVRQLLDSYEMVTLGSYHPGGIITALMPRFFGNFAENNLWPSSVPWNFPEYNLYVGTLPLLLLLFTFRRSSVSEGFFRFALVLAVLGFILAMGSYTPFYKIAYLIPGFDRFRSPSRAIVLWVFALGVLAGKCTDDFVQAGKNTRLGIFAFLTCLATFLILFDLALQLERSLVTRIFHFLILHLTDTAKASEAVKTIDKEMHRFTLYLSASVFFLLFIKRYASPKCGALCLCALVAIDLVSINGAAVQRNDGIIQSYANTHHHLDAVLGKDRDLYRVGTFRSSMGPNFEMYASYQTVCGYTALILQRYYDYINHYSEGSLPEGWQAFFYGRHEKGILMDLLNVKYEISHESRGLWVRKSFLPRAFLVQRCEIHNPDAIMESLVKPDFDPRMTVLLEKAPRGSSRNMTPGSATVGKATITSYHPDRIVVSVNASWSGFLFLSEIFYPGWKVSIDGIPGVILRGNFLFRVVEVPEGSHEVIFSFAPRSIKIGATITLFTLFFILVWCYARMRGRGRSRDHSSPGVMHQ